MTAVEFKNDTIKELIQSQKINIHFTTQYHDGNIAFNSQNMTEAHVQSILTKRIHSQKKTCITNQEKDECDITELGTSKKKITPSALTKENSNNNSDVTKNLSFNQQHIVENDKCNQSLDANRSSTYKSY